MTIEPRNSHLLEGMGAIPWKDIGGLPWDVVEDRGKYGSAEGVPALLHALTSSDPDEWVPALGSLHESLCYLGTSVAEATAYAVPFLVELAHSPRVVCRARLLELLGEIVGAATWSEDTGIESVNADRKQMAAEMAEWGRHAQAAVWHGMGVYLHLLADANLRVRLSAPYTLAMLIKHTGLLNSRADAPAQISWSLAQRLAEEPEALIRASLIYGLGTLAGQTPENLALLRRTLAVDPALQVRVSAALWLAECQNDPMPAVMDILVGARVRIQEPRDWLWANVLQPKETHEEEAPAGDALENIRWPWSHDGPRYVPCLCRLLRHDRERVLPLLLDALRSVTPYTAREVAGPIFKTLFTKKLPPDATEADLTPPQRAALQVWFGNPLLWTTQIGNYLTTLLLGGTARVHQDWARIVGREEGAEAG